MSDTHQMPIYRLIVEIRRAFHELAAVGDTITGPFGLTAAERAVLEYLVGEGRATVPDIAREKSVTRQHIQKLADSLVAKGLAAFRENPAHKRSQLLEASRDGIARFDDITRAEGKVLQQIAPQISEQDIKGATATIQTLREALPK